MHRFCNILHGIDMPNTSAAVLTQGLLPPLRSASTAFDSKARQSLNILQWRTGCACVSTGKPDSIYARCGQTGALTVSVGVNP
jgi:hypothetical protein